MDMTEHLSEQTTASDVAAVISIEPFDSEAGIRLRAAARLEHDGQTHVHTPEPELSASTVVAHAVARSSTGEPLGCGSLVPVGEGTLELRRFFVRSDSRGAGVGTLLLASLEDLARSLGARAIAYETAPELIAAVRFITRYGYQQIPLWGPYADSIHSICFARTL